MRALTLLLEITLSAAALAAFIYVGVRMVRGAKRRSPTVIALGAVLLLFGFGNVRDPQNQLTEQAQPPKKREGESGDPPVE